MAAPLITIVAATYNRSRVLAHAIESVRRSDVDDWELLVVGDRCTDDTASVVTAIDDARISFVNLTRNHGEQSGPNNHALARARGRYVAFLNHDDMFFPDHLGLRMAWLEQTQADFVWEPLLVGEPVSAADLVARRYRFRLSGVTLSDDYHPSVFVFASSWLMTRELAQRIGPWRPARETFVTSSQDWLHRAWRAGARMRFHPRVSVLALPAGARADSYTEQGSPEHDHFAEAIRADPEFRATALELAAIAGEREANRHRFGAAVAESLRGLLFRPVSKAAEAVGMHPLAPFVAMRYGRRGNLVNAIRRHTGLSAPVPR